MQQPNRITLIALGFSSLLLFSGLASLGFTYMFYPTLVPSYGRTERFNLAEYNNYHTEFSYYANSQLHITIEANSTMSIFIDENYVHNGSFYELTVEPKEYILITLNSTSAVSGRFLAWQEPPWSMQVGSLLLLFTGFITTVLSLVFWYRLQKKYLVS
ncbi:MAG: hypothetical protein JSW11_15045 [Candidatus Heimdallarchaeota archaeon]|nr:MAG: hypothetical protein JSW11_15045 [Candidatus Heimdallarchaeota archaeon]